MGAVGRRMPVPGHCELGPEVATLRALLGAEPLLITRGSGPPVAPPAISAGWSRPRTLSAPEPGCWSWDAP